MPHPEGRISIYLQTVPDRLGVLITGKMRICLGARNLVQCAACQKEVGATEAKRYTIRRGKDTHVVSFCQECHAVFEAERNRPNRNPKAGRLVKGVVNALGAVGMVVMMAVFAVTMLAFKSIMSTKFGQEGDAGEFGTPNLQPEEPGFSFPRTFIDEEGGEPMLRDFDPSDLGDYEISDETGQVFQSNVLVDELYSEGGSFSEEVPPFAGEEF